MRPTDHGPKAPLPKELCQVLSLLATGLSTDEVAAHTGHSAHIVRAYLAHAIVELGATSKLDAILKAAARGLIDLPEPD